MRCVITGLSLAWLCLGAAIPASTEDDARSIVTVELTDPSGPCWVLCSLPTGSITVRAGEAGKVIVEAVPRPESPPSERTEPGGELKRIPVTFSELTVEELENVVQVDTHSFYRPVDVSITVPVLTSLRLRSRDSGDLLIGGVNGEIDLENRGGAITLQGVSGTVVAYTLQGDIVAEIVEATPKKPMSFASLNGDLDITLPSAVQATVRIKSSRGEVYSDFAIEDAEVRQIEEEPARDSEGVFRAHVERVFSGKINGGGPEFQFHAYHGTIYIRRGQ